MFIRLPGNDESHKVLGSFDFGAVGITYMWVTCPLVSHRHIIGKMLSGQRDFIFDQIFLKLAENLYRHEIIDKFDFGSV